MLIASAQREPGDRVSKPAVPVPHATLRNSDPGRYKRAAVRWFGRFALEARDVTINAMRAAAEALDDLPSQPRRWSSYSGSVSRTG